MPGGIQIIHFQPSKKFQHKLSITEQTRKKTSSSNFFYKKIILKGFKSIIFFMLVYSLQITKCQAEQNLLNDMSRQNRISSCVFMRSSQNLRKGNIQAATELNGTSQLQGCKVVYPTTKDESNEKTTYQGNFEQCLDICCNSHNFDRQQNRQICHLNRGITHQQDKDISNQQKERKMKKKSNNQKTNAVKTNTNEIIIGLAISIPSLILAIIIVLLIICKIRLCMQQRQNSKSPNNQNQPPMPTTIDTQNAIKVKMQGKNAMPFSNLSCEFCHMPQYVSNFIKTHCNHYFHSKCLKKLLNGCKALNIYKCPSCSSKEISPLTFICSKCHIGCDFLSLKKKDNNKLPIKEIKVDEYICKICELSQVYTGQNIQQNVYQIQIRSQK